MVRRIRKMLRLQAKSVAQFIGVPLLPGDGSVQEIAGIELHRRFGRENFQHPPAGRFMRSGGQR